MKVKELQTNETEIQQGKLKAILPAKDTNEPPSKKL